MKIIFSKHAIEQLKERKLEKIWAEEAVKYPDKVVKESINKYSARKKLNGTTVEVIFVRENYIKILTIYLVK